MRKTAVIRRETYPKLKQQTSARVSQARLVLNGFGAREGVWGPSLCGLTSLQFPLEPFGKPHTRKGRRVRRALAG